MNPAYSDRIMVGPELAHGQSRSGCRPSTHEPVVIRRPHFARYMRVSFAGELPDENFLFLVPRERAPSAHRDCPEMTHRRGTMPRLHVADRQLARGHAVEEVPHVI